MNYVSLKARPRNVLLTPYPSALKRIDQKNKIVVIIDILRACTTIVHAFSQGCKAFYPVSSIKNAREKLRSFVGARCNMPLLGGERNGFKIKGFDLGNSPLEYTSNKVRNKNIIFTTSNCTKNLYACKQPKEVLICSFLNIHHVVKYLSALNDDLIIAMSGQEGDFSLEDAVCAGMLIDGLLALNPPSPPFIKGGNGGISDLGLICRIAYLHYKGNIIDALASSTHGRILKGIGFEEDIKFCAQIGNSKILPRYLAPKAKGFGAGEILCIS